MSKRISHRENNNRCQQSPNTGCTVQHGGVEVVPPNSKAKPKQHKTKAQAGLQLSVAGHVFFLQRMRLYPLGRKQQGHRAALNKVLWEQNHMFQSWEKPLSDAGQESGHRYRRLRHPVQSWGARAHKPWRWEEWVELDVPGKTAAVWFSSPRTTYLSWHFPWSSSTFCWFWWKTTIS